jgi:CheY-like chemotaxis protein
MSMPADNTLEGKKILIVDDDMRNTFALANLLKRYGMHVVLADNGKLALEKLSECDDIKLAIMDIMMPVMDGFEAIKKIRQHVDYKDLPIIALTAKAMPEDRDRCLQIGANDYLAKPVDSHRLMSAIKVWGAA